MSNDVIKLNYEMAEAMAATFRQGTEQLQDVMQEMQNIANTLADGALLGRSGTAFVEAIRGSLCPSLAKLTEKFQELETDVNGAIGDMRDADTQAAAGFSS
jgi:WXG100 family type VII secretion target